MNIDINITEQKLKQLAKLDEYDFTEFINKSKGYQLEWFKMKVESKYPELEEILDNISNNELAIYLTGRYKIEFEAIVTYYFKNST